MLRVLLILALAFPATAMAAAYTPLVSLPFMSAGEQTIGTYLLSIFQLLIGLSGIVAVVRMVTCGFQAIISVNPSAREHASECVVGAITGLLLIFSGWILLNQINPTLLSTSFDPPVTQTSQGGTGGGNQGGGLAQCDARNLCQGEAGPSCSNANPGCAQYASAVDAAARSSGMSATLIREIMAQESSCNIGASSGVAFGLMQLQPGTASQHKAACGIQSTTLIDGQWLRNPINATASICLGAHELRALSRGSCRGGVHDVIAGYNGGPGACLVSRDCQPPLQSCDGGVMSRWECPYNDPAHQTCNTGSNSFEETRTYVRRLIQCGL